MSDERTKGASGSDSFRIKKLEVFSAIVIAVIAASSGWIVALKPSTEHQSSTLDQEHNTRIETVAGHWEIIADGWVFDMCIAQVDQSSKAQPIQGFFHWRESQGQPKKSPCSSQDNADPFQGEYRPLDGEISFTRDPDTPADTQLFRGTIIKYKNDAEVGHGNFSYVKTPGETSKF